MKPSTTENIIMETKETKIMKREIEKKNKRTKELKTRIIGLNKIIKDKTNAIAKCTGFVAKYSIIFSI